MDLFHKQLIRFKSVGQRLSESIAVGDLVPSLRDVGNNTGHTGRELFLDELRQVVFSAEIWEWIRTRNAAKPVAR